jgi:hypothetical protein
MSDPVRTALANAGTDGGTSPAGAAESSNHESSTISLRGIVIFTIWFVVAAGVIHALIWWFFVAHRHQERGRDVEVTGIVQTARTPPPEPRLQPSPFHDELPRDDMKAFRKREKEAFANRSPSWVDPKTDEVRIPDEIVNQVTNLPHANPTTQQNRK